MDVILVKKQKAVTYLLNDWDSKTYSTLELPHLNWGKKAIGHLDLAGNETIADLGAGTGRDSFALAKLLPKGKVIMVERSRAMLATLREQLKDHPGTFEVIEADLLSPFGLPNSCDGAISVAAFHWIHDHLTLFKNIAAILKDDCPLVADCGGETNIAQVIACYEEVSKTSADAKEIWNFSSVADAIDNLQAAGLSPESVVLEEDPLYLKNKDELETFLRTIVLKDQIAKYESIDQKKIIQEVAEKLPNKSIDYVRLKIIAKKLGS